MDTKQFWKTLRIEIYQQTGRESWSIPRINMHNKLTKVINQFVSQSEKVKVLGLEIQPGLIKLALKNTQEIFLIQFSYTKHRSTFNNQTFSLKAETTVKNLFQVKKQFSKKSWYKQESETLKNLIGEQAWKSLVKGTATLNIWRNSTPHNWWVEDKKQNMLWHSDTTRTFSPKPKLSLFQDVNHSAETVSYYGSMFRGSDEGHPQHSVFLLSAEARKYFQKL